MPRTKKAPSDIATAAPAAAPGVAVQTAAAASFAALLKKIDYLSDGDIDDIRRAQRG